MSGVSLVFDPADQFLGTAAFVCGFGTCLFGLLTPPDLRNAPVPNPVVLVGATPACDAHDWVCVLGVSQGRRADQGPKREFITSKQGDGHGSD